MTDTRDKIIRSAIETFQRYGIEKTTMNDIATNAGVSRQTLYSNLGSKDQIIVQAALFLKREVFAEWKERLADCKSIEEQIDVFIDVNIRKPFILIQSVAGARELMATDELIPAEVIENEKYAHVQFMAELILSRTESLGRSDISPVQLARYALFSAFSIRLNAEDLENLEELIHVFRASLIGLLKQ